MAARGSASADHGQETERLGSNNGRVIAWIGLGFGVLAIVMALQGGLDRASVANVLIVLLVMVVVWCVLLRPAVFLDAETLRLRNGFGDVRIPLASVDAVTVRQMLVVHTRGGGGFRSTALTRGRREMMDYDRGKRQPNPIKSHADFVEERIHARADDARSQGAEQADPVQTPAWPEVGAILTLSVAVLVLMLTL